MAVSPPRKKNEIEVEGEYITPAILKNRYLKLKRQYEQIKNNKYCVVCGEYKPESSFYLAKNRVYANKTSHICKECLQDIIYQKDENGNRHGATRESLIVGLAYANRPFFSEVYEDAVFQADKSARNLDFVQEYFSKLNKGSQYTGMTFADSDLLRAREMIVMDTSEFDVETRQQLLQDQKDVMDIVGYDPFLKENPSDKPFLYSQLLALVDTNDEGDQDVYKIQSCISITRDFLKISKLDNMISEALMDPKKLKKDLIKEVGEMTTVKLNLNKAINQTAAENGLSIKNNRNISKGDKTWTGKLKAMKDLNLRDSRINGYDLMTCKGMKQVLDISHRSLCDQVYSKMEDNEFIELIMEQRKLLQDSQDKASMFEEAFRLVLDENLGLREILEQNQLLEKSNLIDLYEVVNNLQENVE